MRDDQELSDEQKLKLRNFHQKVKRAANSTSGHEPLPLLPEKTPEEQKSFNKEFIERFER